MAAQPLSQVVRHLRSIVAIDEAARIPDADLLRRYVHERDETAFEMMVRRYGPMVLGVCRRLLHDSHDVEDAFQVTFLVLVRKASALQSPGTIGNWLYGVAYRTALEARKASARRRAKEAQVVPRTESSPEHHADIRSMLDQELRRLPDKHREVVVLCDLEGKTRKEAALDLGCAEGTVASRLARARTMLAKRLTRHGLPLSAGATVLALSEKAAPASVPASVISSTMQAVGAYAGGPAAAAGAISTNVAALTQGVLRTMMLSKLKMASAVLAAVSVMGLAAGSFIYQSQALETKDKGNAAGREQPKPEGKEPATQELEKLQGTWIAISGEHQSKQYPQEKIKEEKLTLTIKGDRFTLKKAGKADDLKGTLKIDPAEQPKTMDWSANRPEDNLALSFTGIYELKSNTLTFCYGDPRPTEFTTKPDSDQTLYVWKRVPRNRSADAAKEQPSLPIDDLRGNWSGEKDGVKAKLTFYDPQAKWQAHWQVEYKKLQKRPRSWSEVLGQSKKTSSESPSIGVNKGADLKCVADPDQPSRLNLYLPAYLGDKKEIKESSWNGKKPVGQVQKGADGTIQLRIIPTGYENAAEKDYDFPAVEAMILHRVEGEEKVNLRASASAAEEITVEAVPPVVVKTVPQAGTTNVDAKTTEIQVTFSKEMTDKSWSWSQLSDETFPKISGKPKYLEDKRTCVVTVKLEPDKTYAIWLNSEKFGNFKDADGRSAVPYLLVFKTAK